MKWNTVNSPKKLTPEEIVTQIFEDMLEDLDDKAVKYHCESIMKDLIDEVIDRMKTVEDIIETIFQRLPLKRTDKEYGVVGIAAEKIYSASGTLVRYCYSI